MSIQQEDEGDKPLTVEERQTLTKFVIDDGRPEAEIFKALGATEAEMIAASEGKPSRANPAIRFAIYNLGRLPPNAPTAEAGVNPFRHFAALGFGDRIIPIIPPNAILSAKSHLKAAALGKIPGHRASDGTWMGFVGWPRHVASREDRERWSGMGAGVGVILGDELYALDADALCPYAAALVETRAAALGLTEHRVGRPPKRLWLFRAEPGASTLYRKVSFKGLDDTKPEAVELLCGLQHFVGAGTHEKTLKPYRWFDGKGGTGSELPCTALKDLPVISEAALDELFAALAAELPEGRAAKASADRNGGARCPDQRLLLGALETVRAAVAAIPNDYPRAEWIGLLRSIKAALAEYPDEALEIAHEFTERYDGADRGPEYVEEQWNTLAAPHGSGAARLYRVAIERGGGSFTQEMADADGTAATRYFGVLDDAAVESLVAATSRDATITKLAADRGARGLNADAIAAELAALKAEWATLDAQWAGDGCAPAGAFDRLPKFTSVMNGVDVKSLPTREWLIYPWLPANTAVTLVGAPKVGKSSFSLSRAVIVATKNERLLRGKDKLSPERLHRFGPVLVYDAEDTRDEMERRIAGIERCYGVETSGVHLWSGCDDRLIVARREDSRTGRVERAPECSMLINFIRGIKPTLVIIGPLGSLSTGTKENDNDDMGDVVAIIRQIAEQERTAILVVQHTGKGEVKDDMNAGRGASAVGGGVRGSVLMTAVKSGDAVMKGLSPGNYIRVAVAGSNYGEKVEGGLIYRVRNVHIGNGTGGPMSGSAGELFDDDDAEAGLKRRGDTVAVHELVDAKAAAGQADAARAGEDDERRKRVAEVVLEVLGGAPSRRLGDMTDKLIAALTRAGALREAGRRQTAREIVVDALGGFGVTMKRDGRDVRVVVEKDGDKSTSPWIVRQTITAYVT